MRRRVLLTGGAGFVGSHLVQACLQEGWQVGVIYQPQVGISQIGKFGSSISVYPVNGPTAEVLSIVEQFQPELVFHLASVFLAQHSPKDILTLVDSNIAFGAQILEAMALHNVPYLVNAGTSWQHFHDEDYNPVNLYAATKQAFEDILEYYVQAGWVRAITLELFDTYGPADPRQKLFQLLARSARERSRLEMSPGEQLIDLVYVDDVVAAFMVAAKRLLGGQVASHDRYAVSSGEPVRLRDLVEIYQRLTGQTLDIVWGGRPYRDREVLLPWTRGERMPGWEPVVGLEEGIKLISDGKSDG